MGPLTFGKKEEQIFLGREIAQHQDYSEDTAISIDKEIKRIVTDNYTRATAIIEQHKEALGRIADALLVREVLDAEQVRRMVAGEPIEDVKVAASSSTPSPDDSKRHNKEQRPSIVQPIPPLNKPLTQE